MENKRIAVLIDVEYQSEGNYALDTEEETRAAVLAEQSAIVDGELTPYGVVVYRPCDKHHCWADCTHSEHIDSLWGVVAASGHDGDYTSPDEIRDEYVRSIAQDMWT